MATQTSKTSVGMTFHVRIKIDSNEAVRRLRSLQKKMGYFRSYATALTRMVDLDGQLENELLLADNQILTTIELLCLADVEEREYVADGVLVVEAGFTKLRTLLRQVNKSIEQELPVPAGCYLQASALARGIYLDRAVLFRLRRAFEEEFDQSKPAPQGTFLYDLAKSLLAIAEWFHVPDQTLPKLNHRDMEHVYSSDGCCMCKKYR